MSFRSNKDASRRAHFGFQPIKQQEAANMPGNDATIDIPLDDVNGGVQHQSSTTALRRSESTASPTKTRRWHRGRRPQSALLARGTGSVGYDGEEDTVNTMGKLYKKIRDFSVLTRYLLYVVPVGALITIPIVVGATSAKHATVGGVALMWFFVWILVVWASLWGSKLVAHFLPRIFTILAGFVSSGVRKYATVIERLEIPLSLVGWAVASLATFKPLMLQNPGVGGGVPAPHGASMHWIDVVEQILAASVFAALVYLGEKFIIQLISIDYHRKQFHYRIKESKRNIYLLGLLYDASRSLFPSYCNEFAEEDYIISDQITSALGLTAKNRSHHRSGSRTPMRVLHDIGRVGDKITSAFGNMASDITGKQIFDPTGAHSIVVQSLERPQSAEALAKRIWMSFVVEGNEALYQDDLMDVLGSDRRTEAEEAFAALDVDGNGDIGLDEMIMTVTEYGRERKAIASSMHDVDQAIHVLDNLFSVVVFMAVVFIFIAFLNKSFVTTLATAGTALLSLSFVFATTAQEILGSCIFVFVKHPFDVGDRIDIGIDQYIVEHISLLFSVFKRSAGANIGRYVQIPNIRLSMLDIENISRSSAMSEQIEIWVSFLNTSFEDVQILKNELTAFVSDKDNSRDFQPNVEVGILGTTDQSKLLLQIEIRHKSNWANETVRQMRRSKFMCALVAALKKVPIYPPGGGLDLIGSSANPTYTVAVSDDFAKKNVEKAAGAREAARMVPSKKPEEKLSPVTARGSNPVFSPHEDRVVDRLTSRNPALDPTRDQAWTSARDEDSTLGERASLDQADLEDVRGVLRRESTRGKRKPGDTARMAHPSVPTIDEPGQSSAHADYAQTPELPGTYAGGNTGYRSTGASNTSTAYRPGTNVQTLPGPYGASESSVPQLPALAAQTSPIEMRQVQNPPARSPSNPYRKASGTGVRSPTMGPSGGQGGSRGEGDEDDENERPRYSGV